MSKIWRSAGMRQFFHLFFSQPEFCRAGGVNAHLGRGQKEEVVTLASYWMTVLTPIKPDGWQTRSAKEYSWLCKSEREILLKCGLDFHRLIDSHNYHFGDRCVYRSELVTIASSEINPRSRTAVHKVSTHPLLHNRVRAERDVDRIQSRHQEHNPKDCMAAIIQRKYTTDTIQMCNWDQNPKVWILIPVTYILM